jgi:lysophosphatidic acid acyltransferase / lysophosphatidylinositol acyltransferase
MEIPALLTVLPIGLLFLLSGLAINAVQVNDDRPFCFYADPLFSCNACLEHSLGMQAIVFLSTRPFSRSLHRRINGFFAELLWLQPVWLLDWWAGVKVLYAQQS